MTTTSALIDVFQSRFRGKKDRIPQLWNLYLFFPKTLDGQFLGMENTPDLGKYHL